MIILSESLSKFVRKELNISDDKVNSFTEEQLATVSSINISRDDIKFISYFTGLVNLNVNLYPSLTNEDLEYIGSEIPTIKSLKIKEQNAITHLDLSNFINLKSLAVIHNDNIIDIKGIDNVKQLTLYDNKEYKNYKQIVDYLKIIKGNNTTMDFVYYVGIWRMLKDYKIFDSIKWVESMGLRNFYVHQYTKEEISSIVGYLTDITSKFIYVKDDPIEKFSVLYTWMLNNIKFINEDENKDEVISNTYQVFSYGEGGRLSYAKAFRMLLSFVDIDCTDVYSCEISDHIGYYKGKKVFSLLGTSDYELLRLFIDGRTYYCDIALDSLVKDFKYYDELRLFLVSRDELASRHKLVGEGNVLNSYSYDGDDADDLLQFADNRYREVNAFFNHLSFVDTRLNGLELNKMVDLSSITKYIKDNDNNTNYDKELNNLNDTLNNDINEYESWMKGKNNIIKKNRIQLRNKYLENNEISGDLLYNYLIDRLENLKLSKYLFDILIKL